jgi:hypothetical protein
MTREFTRILAVSILVTALAHTGVDAQQGKPLPAFATVSASGAVVTSDRLNAAERWVLVYVVPGTVACDRLLRALDEWTAGDGSRIVVVAAGPATVIEASVRPLVTNASPGVAIYADPDGSAGRALGVTSAPALVGVAHGAFDWMVQGVLNDPHMVEPVVRNWLRGF